MKKMILLAIMVMASTAASQAQLKPEYSKGAATGTSPVFSTTASPDIPMSVTFGGEKVSFDRLDMAERLDRELTGIIYASSALTDIFLRCPRS